MKTAKTSDKDANVIIALVKGALAAAALSIALIALYALALQQEWLSSDSMGAANSAIKIAGAVTAALIAVKGRRRMRWLTGGGAGMLYALLAFITFSILSGTFEPSLALLSDMGMCALGGILTAMLMQLLK